MSEEGQLQVWWHQERKGQDRPEYVDVSNMMGARAIYHAVEREGAHAIRVMQKRKGRWVQVPNRTAGIGTKSP